MEKKQRGLTAVALVLVVGGSFMVMSASAADGVDLSLRHASRSSFMARTHYAAYGALQAGLDKLNTEPTYSCDNINNKTTVDNDSDLVAGISIANNLNGSAPVNVSFDNASVPPQMAYIKVEADFRDFPGKYKATYASRLFIGQIKPDALILTSDDIRLTNTTVTSKGQLALPSVANMTSSKSARIITNAISPNSIIIEGDKSNVRAHVRWGPLANNTTVINVTEPGILVDYPTPSQPPPYKPFTQRALTYPMRICRFRPYTNPKFATDNLAVDNKFFTGGGALPPGEYANVTFANGSYTLSPGQYYIANDVTIENANLTVPGVTAKPHCSLYVGNNFTVTNSSVNWNHCITNDTIEAEKLLGPRTLQIYFVGSGRPRTNDNGLTITNSTTAFHAFGKAMTVNAKNSEIWGGFKGYRFTANNCTIGYHRVEVQNPVTAFAAPAVTAQRDRTLGVMGLLLGNLMPHPLIGSTTIKFNDYPAQLNPFSAWSTEGMSADEAEGSEEDVDYGGGYGYGGS